MTYGDLVENNSFCRRNKLTGMMGRLGLGTPFALFKYFTFKSRLRTEKMMRVSSSNRGKNMPAEYRLESSLFYAILDKKQPEDMKAKTQTVKQYKSPQALEMDLGAYVVGQADARQRLATAVYMHSKRMEINKDKTGPAITPKCNILIIGPTGSGKTHMCRTLASTLGVAFSHCDATQYTETGYVGANVEEMLVQLQRNAADEAAFERGIVFIDEVDKLASASPAATTNSSKDVSGGAVQQELLKLLDGEEISYEGGRSAFAKNYHWNIKNVLFIAGGAFQGLEDIVAMRYKSRKIGFDTKVSDTIPVDREALLKKVTTEDLIEYGFYPEFIGRFPVIITLDDLKKDDLLNIMNRGGRGLISVYSEIFKKAGHSLNINPQLLDDIAEEALKRGTGARGLNAIVEERLSTMLYEAFDSFEDSTPQAHSEI
jgi:ATP-dependent Clp protease ATP-binding subunit ClpX